LILAILFFYFGFTYFLLRNAGKQQANSRPPETRKV
jgi:cbb3-type cytochrome oxidase subunit 3